MSELPNRDDDVVYRSQHAYLATTSSQSAPMKKLGDIVDLLNGDRGKNYPNDLEQTRNGYCLFLSTKNVLKGHFDFTNANFITQQKHEILSGGTLKRGDIVLTIRGTLGNIALYDESVSFNVVRINSAMMIVRPKAGVDPYFIMWALQSPVFTGYIEASARGSAQPHLRAADIREMLIPLPPLAEQRRIVARLDALLGHASRARAELAHLPGLIERQKQAVLAQAFEQANLEAKQILSLGDLAIEVRNGLARRPENNPPGISILKISAIRSMTIRMEEKRYYVLEEKENVSAYTLLEGDLLFTRYNGNPELVANCGMIRQLNEVLIYPDKLIRVRLKRDVVAPQYIEAMASTPYIRGVLSPFIKSAAGQHGISGGDLKRLMFPVPSLAEQAEILRRIETAFARIERAADEARRAAGLLDRLEQATLAQAFRGEL